ncbi:prolyl oligopeptidase family serine peptidase [Oceanirhabdus seepicola]|uniref:Prolyl oligopeptidase family serine peptidase n=1 Tax=Oceanirhabdus seepicola TaxID=2828781 RepID=A0A9J6P5K9_9CLOT|nr:PHB depolymerase family esterase [Oceanirhabdus seepicola]MCM1991867.1 prolyl oligopeptidase family serine peptidase [Oceanirhabdus seepicola]
MRHIKKTFKGNYELEYLLYLPEGYEESNKEWPLMLFLHGAGERGDDINLVKLHGVPKVIEGGEELPFIVIAPQCPEGLYWDFTVLQLEQLIEGVMSELRVDNKRVYLTGLSMGGFGAYALASYRPDLFAAMVVICGGVAYAKRAELIKDIPLWAFHGEMDNVVPVEKSIEVVGEIKKVGGEPKLTIYPDKRHDSWTATYENTEVYEWLLSHEK